MTKGWQRNPVPFDHVLNESSYAWAFGSPDIVHLFDSGQPHIVTDSYGAEEEDFAAGPDRAGHGL